MKYNFESRLGTPSCPIKRRNNEICFGVIDREKPVDVAIHKRIVDFCKKGCKNYDGKE